MKNALLQSDLPEDSSPLESEKKHFFERVADGIRFFLKDNYIRQMRLPLSFKTGAIFVPTFLALLPSPGCYSIKKIDCTNDQGSYIDAGVDFLLTHPEDLQEQMDIWAPGVRVTADDLIEVMAEATFQCGVPRNDDDSDTGADQLGSTKIIRINVVSTPFVNSMDRYFDYAWTQDVPIGDLLENVNGIFVPTAEASLYFNAINHVSGVIAHEIAHIPLGSHSKAVRDRIDELCIHGSPKCLAGIDDIYAIGIAGGYVSNRESDLTYEQLRDLADKKNGNTPSK
ncbi:MAG: hypothetical protein WCT46_01655 [Candidatus Gracilibacteria bacterium]|jgi:hypothetical protein